MKQCGSCLKFLAKFEFYKDKRCFDETVNICKSCKKEKFKEYYKENKEEILEERKIYQAANKNKIKNKKLLLHYGITLETYELLLLKQEQSCAICKIHKSKLKKDLAVDHCHKTGKVRGLLCDACNRSIGLLKEDPVIIKEALNYVQKNITDS